MNKGVELRKRGPDAGTLKVAMAGFFHDIGKVDDRDCEQLTAEYIRNNRQLYERFKRFKNGEKAVAGHFTHQHALYSVAFFDSEKRFGAFPTVLFDPEWGGGGRENNFVNLVGMHHKPETAMQEIVTWADRISSGLDRDEYENCGKGVNPRDHKKNMMVTLFEQLEISDAVEGSTESGGGRGGKNRDDSFEKPGDFSWAYQLAPISPDGIFPRKKEIIPETKDLETAKRTYKAHFEKFDTLFGSISGRDGDISHWFENAESLCRDFFTCVPAARAGASVTDVSLYDHMRTTSAVAAALYLYHRDGQGVRGDDWSADSDPSGDPRGLAARVSDMYDKKFLLVGGELYGIQNFIFAHDSDGQRHRAKLLRGRSFSVSLMAELAADLICRELGLPHTSTVMSAAGKFMVIAPNTPEAIDALERVRGKINEWLFSWTFGETSLGIGWVPARGLDFMLEDKSVVGGAGKAKESYPYYELYLDLQDEMGNRKAEKFDYKLMGAVENYAGTGKAYLDCFRNDIEQPLCPLCRKRPTDPEAVRGRFGRGDEKIKGCGLCTDHVWLGGNLAREENRWLVVTDAAQWRGGGNHPEGLSAPIFGVYQVYFRDADPERTADWAGILRLWDIKPSFEEGNAENFAGCEETGRKAGRCKNTARYAARKFFHAYIPKLTEEDLNDDRFLESGKSDEKKEDILDELDEWAVGTPKSFNHMASSAKIRASDELRKGRGKKYTGIEALGVLKADIDNLGLIFAGGLKKSRYSLARSVTLSSQIDRFFTVWLPHFLENSGDFRNVYTLFAGGDDLFLIGPWNVMPALARALAEEFSRYCCGNSGIHFSAGISVHRPGVPVPRLSEAAEEALEKAKARPAADSRRAGPLENSEDTSESGRDTGKNAVTMFGRTVRWDVFRELLDLESNIKGQTTRKIISVASLYRINQLIDLAEQADGLINGPLKGAGINIEHLQCLKWRARLCYEMARNAAKDEKGERRAQLVDEVKQSWTGWLDSYHGGLRIPLWKILYERR